MRWDRASRKGDEHLRYSIAAVAATRLRRRRSMQEIDNANSIGLPVDTGHGYDGSCGGFGYGGGCDSGCGG